MDKNSYFKSNNSKCVMAQRLGLEEVMFLLSFIPHSPQSKTCWLNSQKLLLTKWKRQLYRFLLLKNHWPKETPDLHTGAHIYTIF